MKWFFYFSLAVNIAILSAQGNFIACLWVIVCGIISIGDDYVYNRLKIVADEQSKLLEKLSKCLRHVKSN